LVKPSLCQPVGSHCQSKHPSDIFPDFRRRVRKVPMPYCGKVYSFLESQIPYSIGLIMENMASLVGIQAMRMIAVVPSNVRVYQWVVDEKPFSCQREV
jgi:hypothetical protein